MTPGETIEMFATKLNTGDVSGALGLYEPDATFVVEPGTAVVGREAIRGALEGFAALQPVLDGEIDQVVCTDDVALVVNRWTLSGTGPDGHPVRLAGRSADVLRRAPSGEWRIVIDNPWAEAQS
jgi:uncharacterized protein (TIGR02246 family)